MWKYKEVYAPNHPNKQSNGCVLEHRLIAERMLGRYLTGDEVVHHKDEDRRNNSPNNLEVFKTQSDHQRYHVTGVKELTEDGTYISPKRVVITLCPTCNSRFENYGDNKRVFCSVGCSRQARRVTERPSKDDLYELLTTKTFTEVGDTYGVSSNTIKNWCKGYSIPSTAKYYSENYRGK